MSNEIQADYGSGNTLYAVIRSSSGQVWCTTTEAFEAWGDNGHAAGDYAIALIDRQGSRYTADFVAAIPTGTYFVQVFLQAGPAPAGSDTLLNSGRILWTGTGELTTAKILANKAVQDRLTGAVTCYDNDGQTILFTYTPVHTAAAVTILPGYPGLIIDD